MKYIITCLIIFLSAFIISNAHTYDERVRIFSKPDYFYKANEKYGYVDYSIHYGLILVKEQTKYGFINNKGKEIVPPRYDQLDSMIEGIARVAIDGKWGLLNTSGQEIIPLKYDYIYKFADSFAKIELNKKYGYIDRTGKEIIPPKYDEIYLPLNVFPVKVKLNWKCGLVDKTGKEIVSPKYDDIRTFRDGLAIVEIKGGSKYHSDPKDKEGLINIAGEEIVPPEQHTIRFSEGLAAVRLKGKWGFFKWGFIDRTGKMIIPPEYDEVKDFEKGMADVKKNGKWGRIGLTGKVIIPPKYDDIGDFNEDIASVGIDKYFGIQHKCGFVDRTGKEIIPLKYDDVESFKNGMARIELNGQWGYVDKTGKEIFSGKIEKDISETPKKTLGISFGPTFLFHPHKAYGGEFSFIFRPCFQKGFLGIYSDYIHDTETNRNRITVGPEIGSLDLFTRGIDGGLVFSPEKGLAGFAIRPFIFAGPLMFFYRFMSINETGDREHIHQFGITIKIPIKIAGDKCDEILDGYWRGLSQVILQER
ncbi:MAG: WG repeat-containing protein [Spirochaetota bacterium]